MKFFEEFAKKLDPEVPHAFLEKNYDKHYTKLLAISGASVFLALGILICTIFIWYQSTHLPGRAVYLVEQDASLKRMGLHAQPISNPNAIKSWTAIALRNIYTLNLTNYNEQIQKSRKYFTPEAADLFETQIRATLVNDILKNKLIVSSMVLDKPIISQSTSFLGISVWKVEAVISILYEGAISEPINKKYRVYLTIVTMPTTENYRGIGISKIKLNSTNGQKN